MPRARMSHYPVFIDLRGRPCVVVGGGKVAERKALSLLRAGAEVTLISPSATARLLREAQKGSIKLVKRRFRQGDLRGAFLAIAATDSEEENRKIAAQKGVLVNVVDRPELCGFIVPSMVVRGPLTIAISTSGASPAMARAIRRDMEASYGGAFGGYLARLRTLRRRAVKAIPDPAKRRRYLESLASDEVLEGLKAGRRPVLKTPQEDPSRTR